MTGNSIKTKTNSGARNKTMARALWAIAGLIILMNAIAAVHAYRFTHFEAQTTRKVSDIRTLSFQEKLKTLLFGLKSPRPKNNTFPSTTFETIRLQSNREIECWSLNVQSARGTIVLFHGYGGHKSSMLDKAEIFNTLGFNTLLVDFMGSGGSDGNQTTIGALEAEQVKSCFDYLREQGEQNIFLFGTSMGAAAIMKAISDYKIDPKGIIIECPFGSMYKTVRARFRIMNVPSFPMASLLVFWGGIENGFWAFGHNPVEYAKQIHCPTLLLYGAQDNRVSEGETEQIFKNLAGVKTLSVYPHAGHENYLNKYRSEWSRDVGSFLLAR